jgi:predicted transposase YdaD
MEDKKPKAKREYKDTVFRMLFSDKKNLLSLYNAVTGRAHENAEDFEIVTLDNAVYMGMKNDLSFLLDTHIYLYEHQSTKNPNMPLRDLFYISLEYQKYVSDKSLYSSTLQKLPAPVFMVFYNGTEEMEERTELRLSQAYEHFEGEPNLELKVMVLNINAGHNEELMKQCRMLKEYAQYVARVRGYAGSMKLEEAVRRAIRECITEGILTDFLRKNRAEVEMVSILEYDKEYEEKKLRKAEYEAGLQQGERLGIEKGEQEGLNRGLAQGIVETGCAYGVSKKEILERLQERLNISCQTAQEYFAMYSGKKIS